jgi:beta-glucosidase
MKSWLKYSCIICLNLLAAAHTGLGQSAELSLSAKVDAAFSRMSPEDKFAELTSVDPKSLVQDGKVSAALCREKIPNGIGQIANFSSQFDKTPDELRDMVRDIQRYLTTETHARIPAIFHDEMITGFAGRSCTLYPQHIGMGCSWNPDLVQLCARQTAITSRKIGGTLALSPMIDLIRAPDWGRLEEGFGEDAYLTSRLGLAFVQGIHGSDLASGVATTGKHFAGYGASYKSDAEFHDEYLMPHAAAISLGKTDCIMPSYWSYKGIPTHSSRELLTDILRNELGFEGLVVSDYGAIGNQVPKYATNRLDAAVKSFNAGMDVEFPSDNCFKELPQALKNGLVSQKQIDDAVRRSLTLKARLGLLDAKPSFCSDGPLVTDSQETRGTAYEAACQSIVLLKNNGLLPLDTAKKIALVGPNADSMWSLCGDYSYPSLSAFWHSIRPRSNDPQLVTLRQGLESRIGSTGHVEFERGCDWSDTLTASVNASGGDPRLKDVKTRVGKMVKVIQDGLPVPDLDRAMSIASQSDVVIAAMGENVYLCGEARDRHTLNLPGDQELFVQKLLDTGKPVILVLFGGHTLAIEKLAPRCAAIIQAWYPGEEGGNALADILLGKVNPSAKLATTYPGGDYKGSICYNMGYQSPPLYPFGYGLSYTAYNYSKITAPESADINQDRIPVSFTLKNIGKRAGTEVTQLYLAPVDSGIPLKPIQLKGFRRVTLAPGEEVSVSFGLSPEQFAYWNNGAWTISPGQYEIRAGSSSIDTPLKARIQLTGKPRSFPKRTIFFATEM